MSITLKMVTLTSCQTQILLHPVLASSEPRWGLILFKQRPTPVLLSAETSLCNRATLATDYPDNTDC